MSTAIPEHFAGKCNIVSNLFRISQLTFAQDNTYA